MNDFLFTLAVLIPAAVLAITFHEAAHALAADALGDPTARERGRASLNPIKHIDPFGTIVLPLLLFGLPYLFTGQPGFLFGWAKPVPVMVWRLRNPRRDMALVAAAGPAINAVLGLVAALGLVLLVAFAADARGRVSSPFFAPLDWFLLMNLALALFNLMPILPLDGGRILSALLPRNLARGFATTEPYGLVAILLLFGFAPWILAQAQVEFSPGRWLMEGPLSQLRFWFLTVAAWPVEQVLLLTGTGR